LKIWKKNNEEIDKNLRKNVEIIVEGNEILRKKWMKVH